jgi:hypothetical protein
MSGWTPGERGVVALAAEQAPSVHNTRPWVLQFHDDARGVSLFENLDRALPRHDPLGRDRLISCGAALTNVLLALRALGWVPELSLRPDRTRRDEVARIVARTRRAATDQELARQHAIPLRHSYRRPFLGTPVDPGTVRLLTAHGVDGVELRVLASFEETATLAKLLKHAALVLRADRAYQRELSAWTAADEHPGVAEVPRRIATLPWAGLVRRSTAVPDVETLTDRLGRERLLLVQTPDDGPLDQVRAGMALQTAWLTAIDAGLVGSVLTQPFQLPEVRAGLVESLVLAGYPQLLFRLGHPQRDHDKEK